MPHPEDHPSRSRENGAVERYRKRFAKGLDLWTGEPLGRDTPHAEFDDASRGVGMKEFRRRLRCSVAALHREKKKRESRDAEQA